MCKKEAAVSLEGFKVTAEQTELRRELHLTLSFLHLLRLIAVIYVLPLYTCYCFFWYKTVFLGVFLYLTQDINWCNHVFWFTEQLKRRLPQYMDFYFYCTVLHVCINCVWWWYECTFYCVCLCVCVYIYMFTCVCTCVYVCVCVCVCERTRVCVPFYRWNSTGWTYLWTVRCWSTSCSGRPTECTGWFR